jgi:hypothetical protein
VAGGRSVHVASGGAPSGPALYAETLKGWWSTPQAKVSLSERAAGDGAFPVDGDAVLYSARTVTLGLLARGRTRGEVQEAVGSVLAMAHRLVTLRVADGPSDTCATGYVEVSSGSGKALGTREELEVTVVCPDPRRYGATPHRAYLSPGAAAGALAWHAGASHGLAWPLSFGDGGAVANVATLRNDGTSTAYPIITASGDMGGLVLTDAATGAQLAWDGHVGAQPVVLDCLSRTASVAGVDASRLLSARGFPSVPAGGEVTLALAATGTGTVCAEWRDTYI